ncbi:hypothetical protein [Actinomadura gamaensis]|uniref:Uncharacterized protein n=1 Tax=Actinomadura gamaensis TaxID=1763541 RepID=A0ABV9U108_9ACTN
MAEEEEPAGTGDESDELYVVVREMTADVCQPTQARVTPPLFLADARQRAAEANATAMPDIRYTVRRWSDWNR